MKNKNYNLKISSFFILSILILFPSYSLLNAKKGVRVKVITTLETVIMGRLLEVRENCLLIKEVEGGKLTGTKVNYGNIDEILAKKKSKLGKAILYGGLFGSVACALLVNANEHSNFKDVWTMAAVPVGFALGGLIGTGLTVRKTEFKKIYDKAYPISRKKIILGSLNRKARYPNPNLKFQL